MAHIYSRRPARLLVGLADAYKAGHKKRHMHATSIALGQMASFPEDTAKLLPTLMDFVRLNGTIGVEGILLSVMSAAARHDRRGYQDALGLLDFSAGANALMSKSGFAIPFADIGSLSLQRVLPGRSGIGGGLDSILQSNLSTGALLFSLYPDAMRGLLFGSLSGGGGLLGALVQNQNDFGAAIRQAGVQALRQMPANDRTSLYADGETCKGWVQLGAIVVGAVAFGAVSVGTAGTGTAAVLTTAAAGGGLGWGVGDALGKIVCGGDDKPDAPQDAGEPADIDPSPAEGEDPPPDEGQGAASGGDGDESNREGGIVGGADGATTYPTPDGGLTGSENSDLVSLLKVAVLGSVTGQPGPQSLMQPGAETIGQSTARVRGIPVRTAGNIDPSPDATAPGLSVPLEVLISLANLRRPVDPPKPL